MRQLSCKLMPHRPSMSRESCQGVQYCSAHSCPCRLPFGVRFDKTVFGEAPGYGEWVYKRLTSGHMTWAERNKIHNLSYNIGSDKGNAAMTKWLNVSKCGALIMNFGHWPLSWHSGVPWQLHEYRARLKGVMRWAAHIQGEQGIPVGWALTEPFPLYGKAWQGRCPPEDWRFPHILHAYNSVASTAAKAAGIDVIDVWSPAFPFFDLAVNDHYRDPVLYEQARLVMKWLAARGVITHKEAETGCTMKAHGPSQAVDMVDECLPP